MTKRELTRQLTGVLAQARAWKERCVRLHRAFAILYRECKHTHKALDLAERECRELKAESRRLRDRTTRLTGENEELSKRPLRSQLEGQASTIKSYQHEWRKSDLDVAYAQEERDTLRRRNLDLAERLDALTPAPTP